MSYKKEIELVFDVTCFQEQPQQQKRKQTQAQPGTIDLWYIAANRERNPIPSTPENDFFLERIRDHVRVLYSGSSGKGTRAVKHLLGMVSRAWERARAVGEQIRMLNLTFPTNVRRVSDSEIDITVSMLVVPVATRVEVVLGLRMKSGGGLDLELEVVPDVKLLYGEGFNVGKMREFLSTRVAKGIVASPEAKEDEKQQWSEVVLDMHKRLLAKGAKMAGK